MVFRYLNRPRGGSTRAFDADVLAWEAAVIANGGSVSLARRIIVDQFVFSEKAAGTWVLTDDYWGLWGENEIQALTSLKQRRLATAVNSPTFTADRDYTMNGTTSYINLGFIPSTHGVKYTGTDQRLGVYSRVNMTSAGVAVGAGDANGVAAKISIVPRNGGNMLSGLNTANGAPPTFALSVADSRGLKAVSRAGGGTTGLGYDRGVRLTDATGLVVAATAVTRALYCGAYNNIGVASSFRAASTGFVVVGGPLSDALEDSQYANVQAWATSVGANV